MSSSFENKDLRATWAQALLTFFIPLFLFFGFRWIVTEPFVIPSGSMIPTLQIHDHILVNKLAYGTHWPFSKSWVFKWAEPRRGEVVVFRYPENPQVFYVKRVIALPRDRVSMDQGVLKVNGEAVSLIGLDREGFKDFDSSEFEYFQESGHVVRYQNLGQANFAELTVPEKSYFVMGDNRDQSSDSRVWGFVPEDHLVGRAWIVWLGCDETLEAAQFLCNPSTIRPDRFLIRL